jgi:hypothetical protein
MNKELVIILSAFSFFTAQTADKKALPLEQSRFALVKQATQETASEMYGAIQSNPKVFIGLALLLYVGGYCSVVKQEQVGDEKYYIKKHVWGPFSFVAGMVGGLVGRSIRNYNNLVKAEYLKKR